MTHDSNSAVRTHIEKFERQSAGDVRAKRSYGFSKRKEYMEAEHSYRMKFGDALIGPVFKMTGSEAWTKNKALEGKFWIALNTNKKARLGRWVKVEEESKDENRS